MRRLVALGLVLVGCRSNESTPPVVVAPTTTVAEPLPRARPTAVDVADAPTSNEPPAGKVGAPAPDLSGVPESPATNLAIRSGHVTVVHFWATWCAPCQTSLLAIDALANDDVEVVALSVDDEPTEIRQFLRQHRVRRMRAGWDDGHVSAERWQVQTMPMTYVVDRRGIVRFVHPGWHDGEDAVLAREVQSLR